MGKNYAKISIKVGDIDIHIEGPYEFVTSHYDKIEKQFISFNEIIDEDFPKDIEPVEIIEPEQAESYENAPQSAEVTDFDDDTLSKKKRGRKPRNIVSETETSDDSNQLIPDIIDSIKETKKTKKTIEKPIRDGFSFSMSFKDWLNRIPEKATGTSKSVLAGYYIEYNNDNHTFKAREVSKLLKAYKITLSNTSKFLKQGVDARRMVEVARNGKESEYMLTREGINYVFKLLGVSDSIPEFLIPKV